MLARVFSASVWGVEALGVEVEVNNTWGDYDTKVVGLPDAAVRESCHRVYTALQNGGYKNPLGRTTINLAPADIRKEGPSFDLPIALGLLAATDQLRDRKGQAADLAALDRFLIVGELALSGEVRQVRGVLPVALEAKRQGRAVLVVPRANAAEAALVPGLRVVPVATLREAAEAVGDLSATLAAVAPSPEPGPDAFAAAEGDWADLDFADVKGQESVKRAVEIAVAGGHNLLMIGPPGSGKSMLAKRIPSIFPPLGLDEAVEATKIHSVAGLLPAGQPVVRRRPFRAPHHTLSDVGLVGGTANLSPGEVTLAHHGVLFLDELPEFKRSALEVLRQPLEDGTVTISRAAGTMTFPAQFMLVAAMNPTPTGSFDDVRLGKCTPAQVQKYLNKVSGPLLDRIDIHVEVPAVKRETLMNLGTAESSDAIRARVVAARARQRERFAKSKSKRKTPCNARMTPKEIREHCALDESAASLLQAALDDLKLSARAYDRILKVARTIADLDGNERVDEAAIAEAVQFRSLDRQVWG
ncbi:MAG TPA: YifB family Mg chelatase-like AAA ATPase [Candidatus Methylacidiphilales bacterium]